MDAIKELNNARTNSQGLTKEEYAEYLREQWKPDTMSKDHMQVIVGNYVQGFEITPEIEAQRKARQTISEQMRQKWIDALIGRAYHNNSDLSRNNGVLLGREMHALLEDSDAPEAQERNNTIRSIITGDDIEKKTQLVFERIQEAARVLEEVSSLTDAQIVERFPEMLQVGKVAWEIRNYLDNRSDLAFSPVEREYVQQFQEKYEVKGKSLLARMQMIANPWYEFLPREQMEKLDSDKLLNDDMIGKLENQKANGGRQLLDYLNDVASEQRYATKAKSDMLREYFQKTYGDSDKVKCYDQDGTSMGFDNSTIGSILQTGKPVFAELPDGEIKAFYAKREGRTLSLSASSPENAFNQDMQATLTTLKNTVKNADPWYLLSGSQEFADMKSELESLNESFQRLDVPPTKKQIQDMKQKMETLKQASDTYLETKNIPYKNDLEQSRVFAAEQIQNFAQEKLTQLGLVERANQKTDIRAVEQEAQTYFRRSYAPCDHGNEIMYLHNDAGNALYKREMLDLTQAERKFTPQEKKEIRHLMAQMVVEDIILQERGDKTSYVKGGNTEMMLNRVGRKKFVEQFEKNSKEFQQLTKNLTAKSFGQFIAGNGARQFSNKILESRRKENQAQAQNQPAGQREARRDSVINTSKPKVK